MSADAQEQPTGTAGTASPGLSGLEAENFELEPIVHLGTRRSALARVQTDIVEAALKKAWPGQRCEIHAMATMGDKNQTTALHEMGAKSLWTHELEALLETGDLDMIVHSLKDMPTTLPPKLSIGAIFPREDPRDAFVLKASLHDASSNTPQYPTLASLPPDSIIGTSSVRRAAQLKRRYPHLRFADVRGNLGTRLAKLDGTWTPEDPATVVPEYSALILAAAGLKRLDLGHRITALLSARDGGMLHAVGQGALGIEVRAGDARAQKLLSRVGCERSARACLAERALMRALEGGCSVPIGVESEWVDGATGEAIPPQGEGQSGSEPADGEELVLRAIVVSLDGSKAAEVETRRKIESRDDAESLGRHVANMLVNRGAGEILAEINQTR
ncbi:porphobilinogen deaminase, dipyromethane cofactor binding domain-containing protein [Phyllosticta citribraziliensis]|uniref:hydroxymethylbilane synthase n=1 Tax=Phyllosticta citribraziliensis TaxID=989973 RepID=A0ABR1L6T4_9PEZI